MLLLEKVKSKRCSLVCWWRCGKPWIAWRRGLLGGVGIRGNYVWCLVIVVIFMGLGGAKRWGGGRGFKIIIWRLSSDGGEFYGWKLNTLNTKLKRRVALKLYKSWIDQKRKKNWTNPHPPPNKTVTWIFQKTLLLFLCDYRQNNRSLVPNSPSLFLVARPSLLLPKKLDYFNLQKGRTHHLLLDARVRWGFLEEFSFANSKEITRSSLFLLTAA